jgi:hypothetical protein
MHRRVRLALMVSAVVATLAAGSAAGTAAPLVAGAAAKTDPVDAPFFAAATSGKKVLIAETWDGGCRRMPDGAWQRSERILTGHVLDWTFTDYRNDSARPDCTRGRVGVIHALQTFSDDRVSVPFTWVDSGGTPAPAPPGLANATRAIGLTARVGFANLTPFTNARARELNQQQFCGLTGWKAGVTRDILDCYTSGFGHKPFKATLLVDDTSTPGVIVIYDGVGDVRDYPKFMPDDFAHHRDTGI